MKGVYIHFRATKEDKELLRKAAKTFSSSMGGKENLSETIRMAVKKLVDHDPDFNKSKN